MLPGEQPQAFDLWKRLWPRTDLSHIHLFPAWESEVQQILHAAFAQLTGIFSHYCKANWTPDDAEESATMDDEEWKLLLDDCQLATPAFGEERLEQARDLALTSP